MSRSGNNPDHPNEGAHGRGENPDRHAAPLQRSDPASGPPLSVGHGSGGVSDRRPSELLAGLSDADIARVVDRLVAVIRDTDLRSRAQLQDECERAIEGINWSGIQRSKRKRLVLVRLREVFRVTKP